MKEINPLDKGIYTNLQELIRLEHEATGFSFLPGQPVSSLLFGSHSSRLRGRGLDFEELRQYRPGDDIRTMDWKATKRCRHPYVKVYSEERERPVLLVIDQRVSMFFGSKVNMKSVTAAQVAAISAWKVVSVGDRIGGIVFNDSQIKEIKPGRSKKTVMQILGETVRLNNELKVGHEIEANDGMFDKVLTKIRKMVSHDYLICIISDFSGVTNKSIEDVKVLCRHNDVILSMVYDPLAMDLPENKRFAVSDGKNQILIDSGGKNLREKFTNFLSDRHLNLTDKLQKFGVPVIPVNTEENVSHQLRRALGYLASTKSKLSPIPVDGSR